MTARKTAPAGAPVGLRAASNGHTAIKPALDLDAFCAEAQHEPFVFVLAGHTFLVPHVGDMDWHDTRGTPDNPDGPTTHHLLQLALGDQYEEFAGLPLPSEGYNELLRSWMAHSGITLPESPASPT